MSIKRGPSPSSELPWSTQGSWTIVPSDNTLSARCDHGCDGGCDDDPREMVQCRQLDHAGSVVCDVYGLESLAQQDVAAILHRVNHWDALIAERDQLRAYIRAIIPTADKGES